jgi:KRAB domain-containing zinc finger protein
MCELCNKKCTTPRNLELHKWKVHGIKNAQLKTFPCDECGKEFGSGYKLGQHLMVHAGEKPFCCHECDFRSSKKYNLHAHVRQKHSRNVIHAPVVVVVE